MASTYSLHNVILNDLRIKRTTPVTMLRAKEIVNAASDAGLFGDEEVNVDFSMTKKIQTNGYKRTQLLGLAEKAIDGRWITLYKDGQDIGTLLHEMAHQMPDGRGHGPGWVDNFKKVIDWYHGYRNI